MLAPPARRLADRRRKAKSRARRKGGLRRYQLWISDRAAEGLINQFIVTGQLSDRDAMNHRKLEAALAALIEKQGEHWAR
jgi:hypothetical protein